MRRVDRRTNALPTDRPTNQPTDTASYRGALSHLKIPHMFDSIGHRPLWGRCPKGERYELDRNVKNERKCRSTYCPAKIFALSGARHNAEKRLFRGPDGNERHLRELREDDRQGEMDAAAASPDGK